MVYFISGWFFFKGFLVSLHSPLAFIGLLKVFFGFSAVLIGFTQVRFVCLAVSFGFHRFFECFERLWGSIPRFAKRGLR